MTILIPQIDTTTDTFGQLIAKTNAVLSVSSNNAVTVNSNTAVGNAAITGRFTAGTLYAVGNVFVSNTTSNTYMDGKSIKLINNTLANNLITASGMLLGGATMYYQTLMSLGNTTIQGSNVTSNNGFFDTILIGNTVYISNQAFIAHQVNTNILYVTGPGAFGSFGTNEANVYITKDGVEVYSNPTGQAVVNSKFTSTDLWVGTVHANTLDIINLSVVNLGAGSGTPYVHMISNTHFLANTEFDGTNLFVNGLTAWANVDVSNGIVHIVKGVPTGSEPINPNAAIVIDADSDSLIQFRNHLDVGQKSGIIFTDNNQGGYVTYNNAGSYYGDYLTIGGWSGVKIGAKPSYAGAVTTGVQYAPTVMEITTAGAFVNGSITFFGNTSGGAVTLQANTGGPSNDPRYQSFTLTLPSNTGGPTQVLSSYGDGRMYWATPYPGPQASDYIRIAGLGVGVAYNPPTGGYGEIRAGSNITAFYGSDRRLKENIKNIENPIEKLSKINGVEFDWTDEYITNRGGEDGNFVRKHDIGVIAQEVEEVLPSIVGERLDGYKGVQYEKIVPLLIEAIKELKQEIENLKASK
jgi:Chaperone of endosialidase